MQSGYMSTAAVPPAKQFAEAVRDHEAKSGIQRMPAVGRSINELEEEIDTLGSVVDDLLVRISPAMHCDGPQAAENPEGRPSACDIDNALQQRLTTLRVIRARLANALGRLEI